MGYADRLFGRWPGWLRPRRQTVASLALAAAVLGTGVTSASTPRTAEANASPIYWGAYVHGGVDDWSKMDAFEHRAGKRVAIQMFGYAWKSSVGGYQAFPAQITNKIRNRGSIPLIDWGSWQLGKGNDQPNFRLRDIYEGKHDAYLTVFAQSVKRWKHPLFIRFNAEMNGWWRPWSEQINGNASGDYVKAWRHVVDIFKREGATNVTWVWCPNVQGPNSTPMEGLYPGDDYTDWVCMDGYNYGLDHGNKWYSFNQIFKGSAYTAGIDTYGLLQQIAPNKPIMIGETSSSEDGGSKSAWITDMLGTQLPVHFPKVKAVIWFNWNDDDSAKDWPIESSPASEAAFRAGIASPYYASNQFGSISQSPIQPLGSAVSVSPPPPPAAAPAYKDVVLADAPIAYWRLGESSGTTAADQRGQRPGTYVASPSLGVDGAIEGDSNPAAKFNGSDEYVTVADSSALSPQAGASGKLSLEAWVKVAALPTGGPGTIVSKGASGAYEYSLRVLPNGAAEMIVWAPGGATYRTIATSANTVTPGSWVHLVGTVENGVALRIYVNGAEKGVSKTGWGSKLPDDAGAPLTIGRRGDGAEKLAATIDDVAIYGTVLSPTQIQKHYAAGR